MLCIDFQHFDIPLHLPEIPAGVAVYTGGVP